MKQVLCDVGAVLKKSISTACEISQAQSQNVFWTEGVAQMCSVKKVFMKISQISQKNICVEVSFLTEITPIINLLSVWITLLIM